VLVNLLSNAIKYTPAGGKIEMRFAGRGDGGVTIEVADTGTGMSAEDVFFAFEPFGPGRVGPGARQPGTGLGLSLARALVRLHSGDLNPGEPLDAGTTATVTLPASAAFGATGTTAAPARAIPARPRRAPPESSLPPPMTETANPPVRPAAFHLALLWLIGVQLRLTILAVPRSCR